MRMGRAIWALAGLALAANAPAPSPAAEAPRPAAVPPIDAPELARLGKYPVGVVQAVFVQPDQADPLRGGAAPARGDRRLRVLIWYPAAKSGPGITYHTALSGEDARDVPFDLPGIATREAPAAPGRFPLVILAHGYGNTPETLNWLGENLASKGYVVVAPAFADPPISIRTAAVRAGPIARRPLDIAFVAGEAQRRARAGDAWLNAADPERTALIGYSMGGYGVLSTAGAPLNPALASLSRGILGPYAAGGAAEPGLRVAGVKAVVALAPACVFGDLPIWQAPGVGAVTAPLLLIAGSEDHVVGYDRVRALFDAPAPGPRALLTFREAGHAIGLVGAPAAMRRRYWDLDWFEDSVWRKDRLLAIETHFITAFLDRYVKGEDAKAGYLEQLAADSNSGRWPSAPVGRVSAYSPGPPAASVWKGFQPSRALGMNFEFRPGK